MSALSIPFSALVIVNIIVVIILVVVVVVVVVIVNFNYNIVVGSNITCDAFSFVIDDK